MPRPERVRPAPRAWQTAQRRERPCGDTDTHPKDSSAPDRPATALPYVHVRRGFFRIGGRKRPSRSFGPRELADSARLHTGTAHSPNPARRRRIVAGGPLIVQSDKTLLLEVD